MLSSNAESDWSVRGSYFCLHVLASESLLINYEFI